LLHLYSVVGRKHLGVIGKDVQRWFPEAVDVVPRYTVPNPNKKKGM